MGETSTRTITPRQDVNVLLHLKRDSFRLLPVRSIETVEDMIKMGVYVNDLNLHDSSRELILAGTQQSAELQLALDQVSSTHQRCQSSEGPSENRANWTLV